MRRCSNGHEVGEGFAFCPHCGERVEETPPESADEAEPEHETADTSTVPLPESSRRWPLSVGWSVVVSVFTALVGFFALLAIYLWRTDRRRLAAASAAVSVLIVVGIALSAGSGSGGNNGSTLAATDTATIPTTTTTAPARSCSSYSAKRPASCISKTGKACSSYPAGTKPNDCFTAAELKARVNARKARLAAAAAARQKAAAEAAAEKKREAAAAKARAAAIAAANAWHKGYVQQDENVYWKWVDGGSCQDFAQNGCWHVEVITRDGCPNYVGVNANEYQGQTIVNQLLDNQGYGIPAKTPRLFELDAEDAGSTTANDVHIDCT